MNAFEFVEQCKGKTEDELRKTIIQNVWHIEDVNEEIRRIEENTTYRPFLPFSQMTEAEKLEILGGVIEDCKEQSYSEIRDCIQGDLMKWDEEQERKAKEKETL